MFERSGPNANGGGLARQTELDAHRWSMRERQKGVNVSGGRKVRDGRDRSAVGN